jgi:hypothetical protein
MPREAHDRMGKVKASMARLLTVVREREIMRDQYMESLKERFYEENAKPSEVE